MDPTQWPTLDPEPASFVTALPDLTHAFDDVESIVRMRSIVAEQGVTVELHSYPGTFHGSGLATEAAVSKRQVADLVAALAARLAVPAAS